METALYKQAVVAGAINRAKGGQIAKPLKTMPAAFWKPYSEGIALIDNAMHGKVDIELDIPLLQVSK